MHIQNLTGALRHESRALQGGFPRKSVGRQAFGGARGSTFPGRAMTPAGIIPLLAAIMIAAAVLPAAAQIQRPGTLPGQINIPGFFDLTRIGQESINVNVWGAVRTAGYYVVPAGTDLSQLLSFSGGPATLGERRRERRPNITVSISRALPEGRKVIYVADFDFLINEAQIYPVLEDGDIIILEGEPLPRRWEARDYLSLVSASVSILLLVDRFIYPIARN